MDERETNEPLDDSMGSSSQALPLPTPRQVVSDAPTPIVPILDLSFPKTSAVSNADAPVLALSPEVAEALPVEMRFEGMVGWLLSAVVHGVCLLT